MNRRDFVRSVTFLGLGLGLPKAPALGDAGLDMAVAPEGGCLQLPGELLLELAVKTEGAEYLFDQEALSDAEYLFDQEALSDRARQ